MAQPYTILVLSDSHGNVDNMRRAVEQFQPHHILHLGDYRRDAGHLSEDYPDIPMTTVAGNCDFGGLDAPEQLIELRGIRILMMHGHTHQPLVDYDGSMYTMNPGAAGDHFRPTCGVITIENGKVTCAVHLL